MSVFLYCFPKENRTATGPFHFFWAGCQDEKKKVRFQELCANTMLSQGLIKIMTGTP